MEKEKVKEGQGPYSIGQNLWPGLAKLVEEKDELGVVCGKLIGSGGDTNHWSGDLQEMFIEELADIKAAIFFFMSHNFTYEEQLRIYKRMASKVQTYYEWHEKGISSN